MQITGANMYINLALVVWLTNQMEAEGKIFGVHGELQDFLCYSKMPLHTPAFMMDSNVSFSAMAVSQVKFNSMVTGNNFVTHVIYTMRTSSHVLF